MSDTTILESRAVSADAALGGIPFARALSWATKGGLAILDQGLFAGANFLVNILLARWLTPGEYGAFALAYSVFLLLGAFHTAILTEPMLVFGPGKYAERFREYLAILLRGHLILMLPGVALLGGAALLLGRLYSPGVDRAFLGLAFAGPFILLLWLVRRAFYAQLQPGWAAAGGGVYLVILVASVLALNAAGVLSPFTGFLAMGGGALIVGALLLLPLRPRFRAAANPAPALVATDHWRYGRWALATAGVSWIPSNIYFILLPAWFGLEAAGALKALMNLANPALHTITALGVLLLPTLVRNRKAGGIAAMNRTLRRALALFLAGSALYLVLLWSLRSELFHFLYAGKYQEYSGWPLVLVGILALAYSAAVVLGSALRAIERPDWIFWSFVVSTGVTLAVGIPLSANLGVGGAAAGLLLSSLVTGFLSLLCFGHCLRVSRGPAKLSVDVPSPNVHYF